MDIDGIFVSRNDITTGTGVVPIAGVNLSGNVISSQTTTSGSITFDLSHMRRTNGLTRGGTNTNVVIYGTAQESNGTDITYVNSAANGDSFTINTTGIYSVSVDASSAGAANPEIRIGVLDNSSNDSKTRGSVSSINNSTGGGSWIGTITAGQAVWFFIDQAPAGSVNRNQITITRLR